MTATCRTCRTVQVEITRTDGSIDQLDSSGDVICDECWESQQNAHTDDWASLPA